MDSPALHLYRGDVDSVDAPPVRGVRWVLAWAAALAILTFSAFVLTAFAYQIAAELALRQAAKAGLREASLPRATSDSVEAVVRRQLRNRFESMRTARMRLALNGVPIRGQIPQRSVEQLSLSLAAAANEFMPRWLNIFAEKSIVSVTVHRPMSSR